MLPRVLVIDDEPSVVSSMCQMLRTEGFTVYHATDPRAGLRVAACEKPDAIIVDLRMPILNGVEFVKQVRAHPHLRNVGVSVVTGDYFVEDEVTHELETLGASLFFKPLWPDDLSAIVEGLAVSP